MKGRVILARNTVEAHIIEDTLHSLRVRYEVWRTREYEGGRYYHYWCGVSTEVTIKWRLFKKTFKLFQAERRKQRVAAL